ncbi:Inosine triphosphate pyrophosphatase [Seminavis robusta]|uniref:Multifunctional fusion protein n=1 Tax=Seminavis robusta TaxID=568900 RepID=A0A9N8E9N8_9STRA|nr:Inosine triphosphate pyrophosphatase [Seminavis robusta]|eukprot:Sro850_g210660.1 Inosine triphosphate pyrophosphatase (531) ;mRNA; f:19203-20988
MSSADTHENGQVVVVGSANQDLISYTSAVPVIGQTVMGKTFETTCGGKGANQAVAAASLGMVPVSMVCRVAEDVFGQSLLNNFRNSGVIFDEESTVLKEQGSSGVAAITVDTKSGDNMIIVTPGTNFLLSAADVRRELENQSTKPAVVLVQLEIVPEAALEALKVGRELGAITILNTAPAPEDYSLDDFLPYIDILIPNETELQAITGGTPEDDEEKLARMLLEKGVKKVLVTLGARGAMIVEKTDEDEVKVTKVEAPDDLPCKNDPVEDTIGAGDAFCGALSTYLTAGLPLSDAANRACGVASMSVRKRGAQTSYPTPDILPECLQLPSNLAKSTTTSSKKQITFVTGNKKKLEEVEQLLLPDADSIPFTLTNRKVDLPELQGNDPAEIAKEKCRLAAQSVNGPVLTEDTSLCFNALNGLPGPYIKWFLEKCGHAGLNNMLDGFEDKSAYAQTVAAFTMGPGEEIHVFDGRTDGKIVSARGKLDFGWDPIFEPHEGGGKTYAEMENEEKNAISHRGRSFAKLKGYLSSL